MSVRSMYGASCVLQHMVRHKSSSLTASSPLVDGSGWRCSQRLACTMPCYHSSLLRDSFSDTSPSLENIGVSACTHDAGTPKSLGRGPLGEARLGGEEGPERLKKTGMQNKCDSYTMCMSDAGMQNEV